MGGSTTNQWQASRFQVEHLSSVLHFVFFLFPGLFPPWWCFVLFLFFAEKKRWAFKFVAVFLLCWEAKTRYLKRKTTTHTHHHPENPNTRVEFGVCRWIFFGEIRLSGSASGGSDDDPPGGFREIRKNAEIFHKGFWGGALRGELPET